MTILQKFIENNNLSFQEGQRNASIVILCGFALYNEISIQKIHAAINDKDYTPEVQIELSRVYEYAERNIYGEYWNSEDAKTRYKF
jgi:hypothetical protein